MDGALDMDQPFRMTLAKLFVVEPPEILVLVLFLRVDTDTVTELDLPERIEVDYREEVEEQEMERD